MIINNKRTHRSETSSQRVAVAIGLTAVLICTCYTSPSDAQEQSDSNELLSFEPELGAELRSDENIFRSATGVLQSWVSIVSPRVSFTVRPSRHRFELTYTGDFARYYDSDPDDYNDHSLEAGAYLKLGRSSQLDLVGSYVDAHEDRGTGLTEGFVPEINIPAEPDEYELAETLGRFTLGSGESRGRFVIEGGVNDLEYTNHLERTRFFSRTDLYGNVTFYVKIASKMSLLADARVTDVDYGDDLILQPSLNNTEYRYFLGATWDTTATTNGTIKVGYMEKRFGDPVRGDFSDPSWEADIRWSPRTYSHFNFRSARLPSETNGLGSFVDNTVHSVTWEHEWSRHVKSEFGVHNLDQEYRDAIGDREQETRQYVFAVTYQMRRWLGWRFGVEVNERESNIERFGFDGNIYSIGVLVTR